MHSDREFCAVDRVKNLQISEFSCIFFVAASNQLQKERKKMRFFELKMTLVIVINYLIIHFRVKETKYVRKNEQKREITKVQRKDDSKTKRNRIELSSSNAFVP